MAVAVTIDPHHMSKDDYERVIHELQASGSDQPEGRLTHTAYGADDVHMLEVWDSEADFEAHRGDLFAALQSAGLDGGSVEVHPVHSRPD